MILLAAQFYSQPDERTKFLSINCSERPLRNVLEEIKAQTGINFVFNDNLVRDLKVTCNINNDPVDDAVNKILSNIDISYKIFNNNSFVLFKEKKKAKKIVSTVEIEQPVPDEYISRQVTKPEMIYNLKPNYPEQALKNNIEGDVILKLFVDENGNITKSGIRKSSGFSVLDSAAIRQSRDLRFHPAMVNGEPNSIWISIVFKYRINGRNTFPASRDVSTPINRDATTPASRDVSTWRIPSTKQ